MNIKNFVLAMVILVNNFRFPWSQLSRHIKNSLILTRSSSEIFNSEADSDFDEVLLPSLLISAADAAYWWEVSFELTQTEENCCRGVFPTNPVRASWVSKYKIEPENNAAHTHALTPAMSFSPTTLQTAADIIIVVTYFRIAF